MNAAQTEKIRREIECLNRLQATGVDYSDILDFLLLEKVVSAEDIRVFKQSADKGKGLQGWLARLSREEKLQLLEYEWVILPVERIKLTIVTARNSREFTYDS